MRSILKLTLPSIGSVISVDPNNTHLVLCVLVNMYALSKVMHLQNVSEKQSFVLVTPTLNF